MTTTTRNTTMPPTTSTATLKSNQQADWGGTVGAFVALLLIAILVLAAAIFVWILVLKRRNPELKPLEALKQIPSAAIEFSKNLTKKLISKKPKDSTETESAGADDF